jgi:hypothetical protein
MILDDLTRERWKREVATAPLLRTLKLRTIAI